MDYSDKIEAIKTMVPHVETTFRLLHKAAKLLYQEENKWEPKFHIPSWSDDISSFHDKKANKLLCNFWNDIVDTQHRLAHFYYLYHFDGQNFNPCSSDDIEFSWNEFKNSKSMQDSSILFSDGKSAYLALFGKAYIENDSEPGCEFNGQGQFTRYVAGGFWSCIGLPFEEMDEAYQGINGLLYDGPWITPEIEQLNSARQKLLQA